MPIKVGKNFILDNNLLSVEYGDIFKCLNVARAWVNNSNFEDVVYTTKTPIIGDKLYSDVNLTTKSTIKQIISNTTIVDSLGIVYTSNMDKNSFFKGIPEETKHEYITLNDLLNLRNI